MEKTEKPEALAGLTVPTTPAQGGGSPLPPSDPLPISELESVGGYQLVRLLGRGGMGAVYEAVDPDLGRAVAVKVMLPSLAANADARRQFLQEARTLAAINHDHVVTIFRVGEERGIPFLAMELLVGESLADRCRRSEVSIGEAVRITREVAAGLSAIHMAGVIHRDVKPDNVWLEHPGGRAKLLDFGLARRWEDAPHPGSMAGTLVYMAPEQARGNTVDHRADIFALGVVSFRMLTGQVPFSGKSMKEIVDSLLDFNPPPIRELNPGVPAELANLVQRMIDKSPNRRPSTAADIVRELATIEARMMVSGSGIIGSGMTVIVLPNGTERIIDPAFDPVPVTIGRVTRQKTSEPTLPAVPLQLRPAPDRPHPSHHFARLSATVVGVVLSIALAALVIFVTRGNPPVTVPPVPATTPATQIAGSPTAPPPRLIRMLLDANDLDGWYAPKGEEKTAWTVHNGVLVCTPLAGGTDQFLLTNRTFDDFDLRLEYRWLQAGGHTTVLFRAFPAKPDTGPSVRGLMVNIGDDDGFPLIHGRDIGAAYRTGSIQFLTRRKPSEINNRPIGEWNDLRIVARRTQIRVEHNGKVSAIANLDQHIDRVAKMPEIAKSRGSIGLVAHWGPIEYRNIRINALVPEQPENP